MPDIFCLYGGAFCGSAGRSAGRAGVARGTGDCVAVGDCDGS